MDEFKLTKEDLAVAEKNGIHERLARFRYEQQAWEKERAITQKPRVQRNLWPKFKELAESNGIGCPTFYGRIYMGWTPEEAAATPVIPNGRRVNYKYTKISDEMYALAESNGISKDNLWARVNRYKWSMEDATTKKPVRGGNRSKNRNSDFNKPIEKRKIR